MLDWFNGARVAQGELAPKELLGQLTLAAGLGMVVALIYYATQRRRRGEVAQFVSTLVLLTVLLAMVTLVIGDNVARAFGLVGALSIVRFRTVVDDTRDTAFVIFAVVVGMGVGARYGELAACGIPVVGLTAWLLSLWGGEVGPRRGALVIRTAAGLDPEEVVGGILRSRLTDYHLTAAGTANKGAAFDVTYAVRLKGDAAVLHLLAELGKTEGVMGVEWKDGRG